MPNKCLYRELAQYSMENDSEGLLLDFVSGLYPYVNFERCAHCHSYCGQQDMTSDPDKVILRLDWIRQGLDERPFERGTPITDPLYQRTQTRFPVAINSRLKRPQRTFIDPSILSGEPRVDIPRLREYRQLLSLRTSKPDGEHEPL